MKQLELIIMEKKKFIITTSNYPPYHIGGDATHVKYLSEELARLGHEVHVMFSLDAYRYKKPDAKIFMREMEESNGVFLHPLQSPLGRSDLYITYLSGRSGYVKRKFDNLIEEIRPDVVHHHNIFFLGYDILKKRRDYVNVYTAHDYWLICQRFDLMKYGTEYCRTKNCLLCTILAKRLLQVWRKSTGFRKALEDIDTIIAPSKFMKERLSEWLPAKVNILHLANFVPPPPGSIKDSGYSNYILFVGVLEKQKGICNLLKAFEKNRMDIDAKLLIVGKGSLKNKIIEYIAKNRLDNKVIFLGWVNDEMLWSLYKDALALVIPSIWPENNPMVALEAMSVGTPVIGTNAGGIGEIIEKIDRNYIFKGDQLENIEDVIKRTIYCSRNKIKDICNQFYSSNSYLEKSSRIIGNRNNHA